MSPVEDVQVVSSISTFLVNTLWLKYGAFFTACPGQGEESGVRDKYCPRFRKKWLHFLGAGSLQSKTGQFAEEHKTLKMDARRGWGL